jgi:hypothetical protein
MRPFCRKKFRVHCSTLPQAFFGWLAIERPTLVSGMITQTHLSEQDLDSQKRTAQTLQTPIQNAERGCLFKLVARLLGDAELTGHVFFGNVSPNDVNVTLTNPLKSKCQIWTK